MSKALYTYSYSIVVALHVLRSISERKFSWPFPYSSHKRKRISATANTDPNKSLRVYLTQSVCYAFSDLHRTQEHSLLCPCWHVVTSEHDYPKDELVYILAWLNRIRMREFPKIERCSCGCPHCPPKLRSTTKWFKISRVNTLTILRSTEFTNYASGGIQYVLYRGVPKCSACFFPLVFFR